MQKPIERQPMKIYSFKSDVGLIEEVDAKLAEYPELEQSRGRLIRSLLREWVRPESAQQEPEAA
jgi:hypothetical protein